VGWRTSCCLEIPGLTSSLRSLLYLAQQ
jgi:hypothetical protein